MDVIDKLEKFRLENKFTQEILAKKLDVAYTTINRWLNRRSKPRKIQAFHIQKLLAQKEKKNA